MQITKFTQSAGEVSLRKMGFRTNVDQREAIMDDLASLKDILKIDHKVEDIQIVFTGAKKETLFIVSP